MGLNVLKIHELSPTDFILVHPPFTELLTNWVIQKNRTTYSQVSWGLV